MPRQYLSSDSSQWTYGFGSGVDGAYAPSTSTGAPIDSTAIGTIATTTLTATNASFAAGQLLLIHQSQGTGAGQWELNRIQSYTAGTITLSLPLQWGYVTGAQVLELKQYSSVNIAAGVTLTAKAWSGTVGGILGWFCSGTTTVTGTITAAGRGFLGGNGASSGSRQGRNAEGTTGAGQSATTANNQTGGGGGAPDTSNNSGGGGGAGGSNGAAGTQGTARNNGGPGLAGPTITSTADLISMTFGGGGGEGGADDGGSWGRGGYGGGIVLAISRTITVTGEVTASGENGTVPTNQDGGHGGGAGGSILFKGQVVTLGSSLALSTGGTGSTDSSVGGNGGVGRIHADYSNTLNGTTSPTLNSLKDSIYGLSGGAAAFLLLF